MANYSDQANTFINALFPVDHPCLISATVSGFIMELIFEIHTNYSIIFGVCLCYQLNIIVHKAR